MTRTPFRLLVLALTWALSALVLTAPAHAAEPYCGITWGSLAKQAGNSAPGSEGDDLAAVRAGRHSCYDRLVLDITGTTHVNSWRVEYVPTVRQDGSGAVVQGSPRSSFVLLRVPDGARVREELRGQGWAVRRGDTFPGLTADHLRVAVREPAVSRAFAAALIQILRRPGASTGDRTES